MVFRGYNAFVQQTLTIYKYDLTLVSFERISKLVHVCGSKKELGIPVVAVIDSNSSPNGITFPIPGNDDAIRSIALYCELIAASVLDGLQQEAATSGADIGDAEEAPAEDIPTSEIVTKEDVATNDPAIEEAAPDAVEQTAAKFGAE